MELSLADDALFNAKTGRRLAHQMEW